MFSIPEAVRSNPQGGLLIVEEATEL